MRSKPASPMDFLEYLNSFYVISSQIAGPMYHHTKGAFGLSAHTLAMQSYRTIRQMQDWI